MDKHHWVFISTHFDDVALSCGALVWDLAQRGHTIEVWTVMGGYPHDEAYSPFAQRNHAAWGMSGREAIEMRRAEDRAACEVMGAQPRHFDWPDVIYRRGPQTGEAMVNSNDELFGKAPEDWLVAEITAHLQAALPPEASVILPIGLGGHIDHRTVVSAGAGLPTVTTYYADYPYILTSFADPAFQDQWVQVPRAFNPEALQAWQDAVLCYTSQLSGFWRDETETRLAIRNYLAGGGGRLWVKRL